MLFTLLTLAWSFTWFAGKYIVTTTAVLPEILAGYRFFIAGIVLLLFSKVLGLNMRPSRHEIKVFIIASMFGCSINLFLFYYAAYYLISGFSSIAFSMIIILNLVIGSFFGIKQVSYIKIIFLAFLGISGLCCIVVSHCGVKGLYSSDFIKGITLCFLATTFFSISSTYYQTRKNILLHPVSSFTYMCFFGAVWCIIMGGVHALYSGAKMDFSLPFTTPFILGFLYLSIFGTAVGYLCSFTLVRRIGSVKTGYSSLIVPVLSMSVSSIWEGYNFSVLTIVGMFLILISEFFALNDKKLK